MIGTVVMTLCILLASSVFHLDQITLGVLVTQVIIGFLAYTLVIALLEKDLVTDFAKILFLRGS